MRRLAAVFLMAALCLGGCEDPLTTEQQIIGVIQEMEQHGEAGERGDFMARVHEEFLGQEGRLTRDEFQRFMVLQWNRNQRLHAQLFPVEVTEDGDQQASARFKVLVTGGRGFIPERGQLFEVFTIWQREDGEWLLYRANWKPVEFEGLAPSR